MKNITILLTTRQNEDGICSPSTRANLHGRINHRATSAHHIDMLSVERAQRTREQRKNGYEFNCLERGIRPFDYTDAEWSQHLADVASEEHTEHCAARDAWMYEH